MTVCLRRLVGSIHGLRLLSMQHLVLQSMLQLGATTSLCHAVPCCPDASCGPLTPSRSLPVQISQPLAPLVDEFAQRLFRELDYEQEGRNAEHFQQLYGDVPRVSVLILQPVSKCHAPFCSNHASACRPVVHTGAEHSGWCAPAQVSELYEAGSWPAYMPVRRVQTGDAIPVLVR